MTTFQEMAARYSSQYKYKLKKISEILCQTFKLNYFFYFDIRVDRTCSFIGSDPELVQHYMEENMHYCNPFFVNTHLVQSGLYLYNSVPNNDFQTSMQRIEQKYKARHCALLTKKDQNGWVIYGFATHPKVVGNETLLSNHVPVLRNFTQYFEDEMNPVLKKMSAQPVDMRSQLDVFANKSELVLPEIHLDKDQLEIFLKAYSTNPIPKFSRREKDVINLFLKGQTAREIAQVLSLSHRTVQHYLENIKNKLGCNTRSEAFAYLQVFNADSFFA